MGILLNDEPIPDVIKSVFLHYDLLYKDDQDMAILFDAPARFLLFLLSLIMSVVLSFPHPFELKNSIASF